jgi:hypothetical protein
MFQRKLFHIHLRVSEWSWWAEQEYKQLHQRFCLLLAFVSGLT